MSGAVWSCRLSSRSGDCDLGHDALLVVVHVAKSAADTLDLFDSSVEAFGACIGDLLGQRDDDGWAPGSMVVARRVVSSMSARAQASQAPQPVTDAPRVGLGKQLAQQHFTTPRGADLVGRIIVGQNFAATGRAGGPRDDRRR